VGFYLEENLLSKLSSKQLYRNISSKCVIFFDPNSPDCFCSCIFGDRRTGPSHYVLTELLKSTGGDDSSDLDLIIDLDILQELIEVRFVGFDRDGKYNEGMKNAILALQNSKPLKSFFHKICNYDSEELDVVSELQCFFTNV